MTPNEELRRFADEFLLFLQESAEYQSNARARQTLDAAAKIAATVGRRLHLARHRCVVALVGLANVGKSTLLNALLGAELAPARNVPCTAIPIEFVHGPAPQLILSDRGHFEKRFIPCQNIAALRRELDDLADDPSEEAGQMFEKVVVELPHPMLESGLILADTPGFGAAQLGKAQGAHERVLREYLVSEVAQVFWVTLAEQTIGSRELHFYQQYLGDICSDVVVTGSEDWSEADQDRYRKHFGKLFGHALPSFHFVSGLKRTGIPELRTRMCSNADPEGQFTTAADALVRLAKNLGAWFTDFRDERDRPLHQPWRPDSWVRLQHGPDSQGVRDRVTELLDLAENT